MELEKQLIRLLGMSIIGFSCFFLYNYHFYHFRKRYMFLSFILFMLLWVLGFFIYDLNTLV